MTDVVFQNLYSYNPSTNLINGTVHLGGPYTVTFTGSISPGDPVHFTSTTGSFTGVYIGTNPSGDIVLKDGVANLLLTNVNYAIGDHLTIQSDPFVCFLKGTLIRTPLGDVPVETLKIGDLVVTASGETRSVKWVGHADIELRPHPNRRPWFPVRVAANAFGPDQPARDLYLSPGHSICADLPADTLIPVGYLVNGATIAQVEVEEVSYWHVELDTHDLLIAENLPAESYIAMGNRASFDEADRDALTEGRHRTHADFCRPVVTEGPLLEIVRKRLVARAEAIGWSPSRDPDLRLCVDGRIVRPLVEEGLASFLFNGSAREVKLLSNRSEE